MIQSGQQVLIYDLTLPAYGNYRSPSPFDLNFYISAVLHSLRLCDIPKFIEATISDISRSRMSMLDTNAIC